MKTDFNSLPWHDSELIDFFCCRRNAGRNDSFEMSVRWRNNTNSKLVFINVYKVYIDYNFGVICGSYGEPIDCAEMSNNNEYLRSFKNRWGSLLDTVNLKYYEISMISTSSKIVILAEDFLLRE